MNVAVTALGLMPECPNSMTYASLTSAMAKIAPSGATTHTASKSSWTLLGFSSERKIPRTWALPTRETASTSVITYVRTSASPNRRKAMALRGNSPIRIASMNIKYPRGFIRHSWSGPHFVRLTFRS